MKKLLYIFMAAMVVVACGEKKQSSPVEKQMFSNDEDMPDDSTIYGYCLPGSDSTCLKLLSGSQDTLDILINSEDFDEPTLVAGGFLLDDRMAVTARKSDVGWVAQRIINLTTLLGHWKSIDRDFEIADNGEINTFISDESHRWTKWRILNGQLVLSKDTFDVMSLNVDSMEIENNIGLYCFMRVRKDSTHAVDEDMARAAAEAKAAAARANKARQSVAPAPEKKDTSKVATEKSAEENNEKVE